MKKIEKKRSFNCTTNRHKFKYVVTLRLSRPYFYIRACISSQTNFKMDGGLEIAKNDKFYLVIPER